MLGLRDYVRKNGFPGVLLGVSGGIDSALCAAIAVDALGADKVRGVMLPYRYTAQASLDDAAALARNFGIHFDRLITITNMPIARFAHQLDSAGDFAAYMSLLVNHFNPATVDHLMCRSLVSVGWDGHLYDCDFNQMLEIPLADNGCHPITIWDLDNLDRLAGSAISTASHCFGCTAGAGSSCSGALA